jgi:putative DNA primase/helicase
LDFPAVAAMAALAGVVGRQVAVRPKRRDDWTVTPNLWALLIGRPGIMKSPAVKEIAKPITRLEIAEAETHKEAETDHKKRAMVAEARKKAAQKKIEDAVKKGADDALRLAGDAVDEEEAPPMRRRYIVSDPTPEKLQVILQENPNGVLVLRDEAQGFLRSLDKPGREDARAFYLECWNGDGRFTVDRIGRGTLDIPACCVSILATIQPGPLQSYLCAVAAGGAGDDGLLPRFQLAVWPDASAAWKNVDRWPDTKAKQTAREVFDRLADLDIKSIGAEQGDEGDVPFLRFDESAQVAFDEWRADLEPTVRSGALPVALEAVRAKYRSLIPSIALLVHLADDGRGPVTLLALTKAIEWGKYLFGHAKRIYGSLDGDDAAGVARLVGIIRSMGGECAPRDLVRGPGGYRKTEEAEAALNHLESLRLGTWVIGPSGPHGGAPPRRFRLHPEGAADKTPATPRNTGFCQQAGTAPVENALDPDEVNRLLCEAGEADEEALW